MTRFLLAALLPVLIGGPGDRPLRLLDRDLRPVEGTARVPARTRATAVSPNGRRFVALASNKLVVVDRRTRRRVVTVPGDYGPHGSVAWPARNRIVTLRSDLDGDVLLIHDLRSGQTSEQELGGRSSTLGSAGRRVWAVTDNDGRGDFSVSRFDGGRYRSTTPVDVASNGLSARQPLVRGRYALVVDAVDNQGLPLTYALQDLETGTRTPIDLPVGNGYVRWVSDSLLEGDGTVVKIDPATATVIRTVDYGDPQAITRVGDGFVVGLGRARYDGDLDLVASNPDAPPARTKVYYARGRLYKRTSSDCEDPRNVTLITDTAGKLIAERQGPFSLGTVNSEVVDRAQSEGCSSR